MRLWLATGATISDVPVLHASLFNALVRVRAGYYNLFRVAVLLQKSPTLHKLDAKPTIIYGQSFLLLHKVHVITVYLWYRRGSVRHKSNHLHILVFHCKTSCYERP